MFQILTCNTLFTQPLSTLVLVGPWRTVYLLKAACRTVVSWTTAEWIAHWLARRTIVSWKQIDINQMGLIVESDIDIQNSLYGIRYGLVKSWIQTYLHHKGQLGWLAQGRNSSYPYLLYLINYRLTFITRGSWGGQPRGGTVATLGTVGTVRHHCVASVVGECSCRTHGLVWCAASLWIKTKYGIWQRQKQRVKSKNHRFLEIIIHQKCHWIVLEMLEGFLWDNIKCY